MTDLIQFPSPEGGPTDAATPGLETEVAALLAATRSCHEGGDQVAAMEQIRQLADYGSPAIRFEAASGFGNARADKSGGS